LEKIIDGFFFKNPFFCLDSKEKIINKSRILKAQSKVLIIYTGGTIGMFKNEETGAYGQNLLLQ